MSYSTKHLSTLIALLCAGLASGCATIEPEPGSEKVEIVDRQQLDDNWGEKCERLGNTRVQVGPDPRTEETNLSPAEVEARNKAAERGATHVAVGAEEAYACRLGGKKCGTCGYQCVEMPATAYKCSDEPRTGEASSTSDGESGGVAGGESKASRADTVTLEEAAEMCGGGEAVIREAIEGGELQALEVDGATLLGRPNVLEFCYEREQKGDE
jgi:hypothetical protein